MEQLQLRQINAAQLLSETAARFPTRPAILCEGMCWNYAEFDAVTSRMARGFLALGLTVQSHVALWTDATPQAVFAFFALQKIGAVAIMLNTCLKGVEIEKQLRSAEVEYLLVENDQKMEAFLSRYTDRAPGDSLQPGEIQLKPVILSHLPVEKEETPLPETAPDSMALMLFTSGTLSANYKVVCSSGFHLANGGRLKAFDMGLTEQDVICSALPMFHTFCINCNIMAAAASGACLVFPADRHSQTLLDCIERHRCTILTAVPSIYLSLIGRADLSLERVKSLRCGIVGGSYCAPEQFCAIERKLGMTLLPGLGQTEVVAGITVGYRHDSLQTRANTLGHFVKHLEGRIEGEEKGTPDAPHIGEIQVRGSMVMMGYYNERTDTVIDSEGWLHTGDLGWRDKNDNIHYAGRIKNIIIRGGENIFPSEIEVVLYSEPDVAECKAVGVPDDHYGEVPCLCVVLRPGATLTEDDIRSKLKARLAEYKIPKYILFFPSLPYTNTGKINCKKVSDMAQKAIQEQSTATL